MNNQTTRQHINTTSQNLSQGTPDGDDDGDDFVIIVADDGDFVIACRVMLMCVTILMVMVIVMAVNCDQMQPLPSACSEHASAGSDIPARTSGGTVAG